MSAEKGRSHDVKEKVSFLAATLFDRKNKDRHTFYYENDSYPIIYSIF